jgi:RHS repeat-associated protein
MVEQVAQPYKFAGVYYDSETALYKMGARYYDPAVGRFTQVDPAQKVGLPSFENGCLPTAFNMRTLYRAWRWLLNKSWKISAAETRDYIVVPLLCLLRCSDTEISDDMVFIG